MPYDGAGTYALNPEGSGRPDKVAVFTDAICSHTMTMRQGSTLYENFVVTCVNGKLQGLLNQTPAQGEFEIVVS